MKRPFIPVFRRAKRPWTRIHSATLAATVSVLIGAGINGWSWLPTGWAVVTRVERASVQLPQVAPLQGRVLFVSPHPDDETLAAAGIIQDVQARGGEVFVVFLTNGDGFPWEVHRRTMRPVLSAGDYLRLGEVRMQEALAATAKLGVPKERVFFLGFPDRGLTKVYTQNYLVPYTSPYTDVSRVPYDGVVAKGAPYTGKTFESLLQKIFDRTNPSTVLAPSALDGHPDHRTASYVAARIAAERNLTLYYYIVHGGMEWPLPKGFHPDLPLTPPRLDQQGIRWQRFDLTPEQEHQKAEAIRAYKSQLQLLSRFMWAFARDNELLLPAPP